ncbi:MAG: transcriptional repressor [Candidatus Bathyarchaeota archaeon]|nr:transcriptional repressor [Candidatus Bathyarchaeota archaeon]
MNDQQIITKLRSAGCKVTPQRLAICKLVLSSKDHPSAEQLYQELKKVYPTISLATVYITLDILKKIGLVRELRFSDRSSRYDPNTSPHINIICPECGRISDYEAKSVKKFLDEIIAETGLKPLKQRFDLYVNCEKCSNKNKEEHAK